jgi:hypothetical protein
MSSFWSGDGKGCLFRTAFEQICKAKREKKTGMPPFQLFFEQKSKNG